MDIITKKQQRKGIVLSLCDETGNMVRPWAEEGFNCICVDLLHPKSGIVEVVNNIINGVIEYVRADVRTYLPPLRKYAIVFAFPPCTHLAISGRAHFKAKGLGKLISALEVVNACKRICEWSQAPYMLENPVSTLSSYWRKPDYRFDPYEYAGYGFPEESYTKYTCLWTSKEFKMPLPKPLAPVLGGMVQNINTTDRARLRSITPKGFAQAVFEANCYVD